MPRAKTIEEVIAATELALEALVEKYRRSFFRLAKRKPRHAIRRRPRQLFGRVVALPAKSKPLVSLVKKSRATPKTSGSKTKASMPAVSLSVRKAVPKGKTAMQKRRASVSRVRAKPS